MNSALRITAATLLAIGCSPSPPADDGADAGTDLNDGDDAGIVDAGPPPASGQMSFFVTGEGSGALGGALGGLEGADAACQAHASDVGAGASTRHAYLSTSAIDGIAGERVNARDRIGAGPWYDFGGDLIADDVDALHATGLASIHMMTELGASVPSEEHDILTGSQENGEAFDAFPGNPDAPAPTCLNWTAASDDSYAYVGHTDWDSASGTWSSAHETTCSPAGLASTAGAGRLYCFAID